MYEKWHITNLTTMRVFPTVRKGERMNIVCARALEKSVRTTVPAGAGEGGGAWHPSSGVGGVVGRWVTIPISSSLETHTSKTTGLLPCLSQGFGE